MGKIIAIANQKGGVGKTTTTVNLGAALAKKGKKTLLIDADPQGNATSAVGVDKECEYSVYDLLVNEEVDIKQVVQDTQIKYLQVCPSNINLAGAEVELVSMMSREQRLKDQLDKIIEDFDYILIDCPPSLGLITLNAFTAANSVLIPVQCEYFALEGLGQLMNTINLVRKHLNKTLYIEGAVLTMYDIRTNLANQVVKEVKKYFDNKVYKNVIPRCVGLPARRAAAGPRRGSHSRLCRCRAGTDRRRHRPAPYRGGHRRNPGGAGMIARRPSTGNGCTSRLKMVQ